MRKTDERRKEQRKQREVKKEKVSESGFQLFFSHNFFSPESWRKQGGCDVYSGEEVAESTSSKVVGYERNGTKIPNIFIIIYYR